MFIGLMAYWKWSAYNSEKDTDYRMNFTFKNVQIIRLINFNGMKNIIINIKTYKKL